MSCPPSVSASELREACDYLLVPFNAQTVRCQNLRSFLHELSNEGAKQQFTEFLEDIILPQMVASTEVSIFLCIMLFSLAGSYHPVLSNFAFSFFMPRFFGN